MAQILIPKFSSRKPGGWQCVTSPGASTIENDTLMCCHCGTHWVVSPGSGNRRGYCANCNALHCGHDDCIACYPFEKRLDDYEAGKLLHL